MPPVRGGVVANSCSMTSSLPTHFDIKIDMKEHRYVSSEELQKNRRNLRHLLAPLERVNGRSLTSKIQRKVSHVSDSSGSSRKGYIEETIHNLTAPPKNVAECCSTIFSELREEKRDRIVKGFREFTASPEIHEFVSDLYRYLKVLVFLKKGNFEDNQEKNESDSELTPEELSAKEEMLAASAVELRQRATISKDKLHTKVSECYRKILMKYSIHGVAGAARDQQFFELVYDFLFRCMLHYFHRMFKAQFIDIFHDLFRTNSFSQHIRIKTERYIPLPSGVPTKSRLMSVRDASAPILNPSGYQQKEGASLAQNGAPPLSSKTLAAREIALLPTTNPPEQVLALDLSALDLMSHSLPPRVHTTVAKGRFTDRSPSNRNPSLSPTPRHPRMRFGMRDSLLVENAARYEGIRFATERQSLRDNGIVS
mgnify:FL=1